MSEICIFNAGFGTRELLPALYNAISNVTIDNNKLKIVETLEDSNDNNLYIIICPAGYIIKTYKSLPKWYITWQLEYMGGDYDNEYYINLLKGAVKNWDYSIINMEILLNKYGIISEFVPPGYNNYIAADDIINGEYMYNDNGKDIDMLFLGYCDAYPRRIEFREKAIESGLKVFFVADYDINEMQNVIRRSKVCVNMAMKYPFVLAKVRLNILLSNQACIVSEKSCDETADELYAQNGVVFCEYERLMDNVKFLVDNYDLRRTLAIKSHLWYRNKRDWNNIVNFRKLLDDAIKKMSC